MDVVVVAGREMSTQFDDIVAKMPVLFGKLGSQPLRDREHLRGVAEKGIYVLYEGDAPIYVGRSDRMKSRLLEHGQPSSTHNSATFAFSLAKEKALQLGITFEGKSRTQVEHDPTFRELFLGAKQRVSSMKIRTIEITNPVEQTLFEVYASLALYTPYNAFDNH